MTIIILGADGYLGWPLCIKLASTLPEVHLVCVDDLGRRHRVREVGSNSLVPILSPPERVTALQKTFFRAHIERVEADITGGTLDDLFETQEPDVVFHLAQQASAPYSMSSLERALFTLRNNEEGNLRVLWALRRYAPRAHLIKMGSFGEYAHGGIDIAEGYFKPTWNGQDAYSDLPYPRQADDIYHITKINDSNFVAMACRKWNLRVTEVMQSTVVGSWVEEAAGRDELATRLDYDAFFGTVLNRFLVQAAAHLPLTVYGSGAQTSGLMALDDALRSLVHLSQHPPGCGQHRVVNHVAAQLSINDIAALVGQVAEQCGVRVHIQRQKLDPRRESSARPSTERVQTAHLDHFGALIPLEHVVRREMPIVLRHRTGVRAEVVVPDHPW